MKLFTLSLFIMISMSGCSMMNYFTGSEDTKKASFSSMSKMKGAKTPHCFAWDAQGKCTVW